MIDLDSKETLAVHKEYIFRKKSLNTLYRYFYREQLKYFGKKQIVLEIGSGGGFLKNISKNIITSDVVSGKGIDKTFSAEKIPLKSSSVDGIVMLNVFHHIKNSEKALTEFQRVLKKGGKVVMIEPWNSTWGRFVYRNFHHEVFDPKQRSWNINGKGRMSDANGAVPWIIFERDYSKFKHKYPKLKLISIKSHTPFSYLLTGGVSHHSIIPDFLTLKIKLFEDLLSNIFPSFSMFATIVIQKL